jgi:hypothetical protein
VNRLLQPFGKKSETNPPPEDEDWSRIQRDSGADRLLTYRGRSIRIPDTAGGNEWGGGVGNEQAASWTAMVGRRVIRAGAAEGRGPVDGDAVHRPETNLRSRSFFFFLTCCGRGVVLSFFYKDCFFSIFFSTDAPNLPFKRAPTCLLGLV